METVGNSYCSVRFRAHHLKCKLWPQFAPVVSTSPSYFQIKGLWNRPWQSFLMCLVSDLGLPEQSDSHLAHCGFLTVHSHSEVSGPPVTALCCPIKQECSKSPKTQLSVYEPQSHSLVMLRGRLFHTVWDCSHFCLPAVWNSWWWCPNKKPFKLKDSLWKVRQPSRRNKCLHCTFLRTTDMLIIAISPFPTFSLSPNFTVMLWRRCAYDLVWWRAREPPGQG